MKQRIDQSHNDYMVKHAIRQRAEALFNAECRAKGALMAFGFGFLSPASMRPYLDQAAAELSSEVNTAHKSETEA